MCQQCAKRTEQDRAFWATARRALLMLVKAIDVKLGADEKQDKAA